LCNKTFKSLYRSLKKENLLWVPSSSMGTWMAWVLRYNENPLRFWCRHEGPKAFNGTAQYLVLLQSLLKCCYSCCNLNSLITKQNKTKQGLCVTLGPGHLHLKSILRQKKNNYENSNISPYKNTIFKKSSKTTKILQDIITL